MTDTHGPSSTGGGALSWMARNPVAANLLMVFLLLGGIVFLPRIKQEVFPEFTLDTVIINVAYPGASPSEVEQGVIIAVEESVRGLDGVDAVRSTSSEGVGVVSVDLLVGTDTERALSDVKAAVDRITSFPEDIERPVVSLALAKNPVIDLVVYGDKSEREIRQVTEDLRERLLLDPEVTLVELASVRPYEISIEIPEEQLRKYGLTLQRVADRVRQSSVEVPGGSVKTRGGEVLVRTSTRKLHASQFEDVVIQSAPDGSTIRVRDVGSVKDTFTESDAATFYNGKRAARIRVFRVAEQTPISVSEAVKGFAKRTAPTLPRGVNVTTWADMSEIYRSRVDLLMRNAWIGLVLVLLILGLFLEPKLAFWVTMGIPISFIGSLLALPMVDVSINMISLFAFIVTLGMVVDDAIVVGEAIYKQRTDPATGGSLMGAAIRGVREVAGPVVFSILTTCVAFTPMLFVPGASGKFFRVIPIIVITVLLLSLIESLLILPSHLAHTRPLSERGWLGGLQRLQRGFSARVERFVETTFATLLRLAVSHRYITSAICLASFIAALGFTAGGHLAFTFLPTIEGDVVQASLELPVGTHIGETRDALSKLEAALDRAVAQHGGRAMVRGVLSNVGTSERMRLGDPKGASGSTGTHLADTMVYLVSADERKVGMAQLVDTWRRGVGAIAGLESLSFKFSTGPASDRPVNVELSHTDMGVLEWSAGELATAMEGFAGIRDVEDGFETGKRQWDYELNPFGKSLGLTQMDLGRQLRGVFYGVEALRQQRGREEVRVFVRAPRVERSSTSDLDQRVLTLPGGGEVPLHAVADVKRSRAYTSIRRVEGRRVVNVTADVGPDGNASLLLSGIFEKHRDSMLRKYPGLDMRRGTEQREQGQTLASLRSGGLVALLAIFGLLAVAFKSYVQPIIVMSAIPFGFIGAVLGHLALGFDLSLMSIMGLVALSGVVVNDSLILVVAANDFRQKMPLLEAVVAAGKRRFRPIILTSLTTFFGLVPMIVETSVQAKFLIPMAVSLGFGVLFATFIILLLVPSLYLVVEDALDLLRPAKDEALPSGPRGDVARP